MSMKMQDVLEAARQLSPLEQLDLIRALSEPLQSQQASQDAIPSSVIRTKPATDLDEYAADFWPDDESLDELNDFIQQQRSADRLSDQ